MVLIRQETYFSGNESARVMFPISSIIELEKGIETSNSATKWKGDIEFNLIPQSEGGVGFNSRPKLQEGVI